MSQEVTFPVDEFEAPYGRSVKLEAVEYEGGMCLLRLRIREGSRFTVLELDEPSARRWADAMTAWADQHRDPT